jgi:hypothetical protein
MSCNTFTEKKHSHYKEYIEKEFTNICCWTTFLIKEITFTFYYTKLWNLEKRLYFWTSNLRIIYDFFFIEIFLTFPRYFTVSARRYCSDFIFLRLRIKSFKTKKKYKKLENIVRSFRHANKSKGLVVGYCEHKQNTANVSTV